MAGFAGTSSHQGTASVVVLSCVCAAIAAALSLPLIISAPAWAEEIDTNPVADEFQQEVERTAAEYDEALAAVAQAEADIQENTVRIDELSAKIPEQQERGNNAARSLYKLQQQESGLLQLLFDSGSFYEFLINVESLNRISNAHIEELQKLASMKTELDTRQVALESARESAVKHAEEADAALKAAQEARLEAQRRAQEEARRQAEEAAALAARAEQAAAEQAAESAQAEEEKKASDENAGAEGKESDQKEGAQASDDQNKANAETEAPAEPAPEPESQPASEPVEQPTNDGADWTADQAAFINEWSGRIDAYLAGSPLSGQGVNFAKAAWAYGVDPRWSPAISNTESSKGLNCFLPYNAWGWGSASWGSWEEAIDAHVAGLARGYGYTISIDNAKKYCPPNWERWYNVTLDQMNMI